MKAENAEARERSLKTSHKQHEIADTAALRILELQTEWQRVELERPQQNAEKLVVEAPLDGAWRPTSLSEVFKRHSQFSPRLQTTNTSRPTTNPDKEITSASTLSLIGTARAVWAMAGWEGL